MAQIDEVIADLERSEELERHQQVYATMSEAERSVAADIIYSGTVDSMTVAEARGVIVQTIEQARSEAEQQRRAFEGEQAAMVLGAWLAKHYDHGAGISNDQDVPICMACGARYGDGE